MSPRRRPLRVAAALREAMAAGAPRTPLAAVQASWARAVGPAIAEQAEPVSERDGSVTVACRSATWAQELDLMQERIRERLNAELAEQGGEAGPVEVGALRFTADSTRYTQEG